MVTARAGGTVQAGRNPSADVDGHEITTHIYDGLEFVNIRDFGLGGVSTESEQKERETSEKKQQQVRTYRGNDSYYKGVPLLQHAM